MAMMDLPMRWPARAGSAVLGALLATAVALPVARADEAPKGEAPAKASEPAKQADEIVEVAPPPEPEEPEWERKPAERRSGFTFGILAIAGLGQASGYPLDLKKVGRERYYTQSDVSIAGSGTAWIGGALTDWITVGLGLNGSSIGDSDLSGGAGGALVRVEAFPLYWLGGFYRELGVMLDGGASLAVFSDPEDDSTRIHGGASSFVGGGVFYEGLRFWHASTGPCLYANYMWSDTVRYGNIGLGMRFVLYSGSSAKAPARAAKAPKTKTARRAGN